MLSVEGRRKELNQLLSQCSGRELLVVLRYLPLLYKAVRSVEWGGVSQSLLDYCWLFNNDLRFVLPNNVYHCESYI